MEQIFILLCLVAIAIGTFAPWPIVHKWQKRAFYAWGILLLGAVALTAASLVGGDGRLATTCIFLVIRSIDFIIPVVTVYLGRGLQLLWRKIRPRRATE